MKTFMDQYIEQIEPKLKAIDLFLKTEMPPYCPKKTAKLLHISKDELETIMTEEHISNITTQTLFQIMKKGSSSICRMFARELERGIPRFYSVEDISYIYNLDICSVIDASKEMGLSCFTEPMLKTLFQHIPLHSP